MNDIYYFIISYALLLGIFFAVINFLSNGFFGTFILVKISRGKKVLVEAHGLQDIYYKAGKLEGEVLKFIARGKKNKSAILVKENMFRKIGVWSVIYNDITDNVLKLDWSDKVGADTEIFDHICNRIAMAPQTEDMMTKVIIGLLIAIVLGILFIGFMTYNLPASIGAANVI